MKALSRILFPVAVMAATTAGVLGAGSAPVAQRTSPAAVSPTVPADTVIYPVSAYKLHRKGDFEQSFLTDTLGDFEEDSARILDTLPHLTARDTIPVPDSLRYTDPFRFKYYVALIDSLTHVIVRDSLMHESDSLKSLPDSIRIPADSLLALRDSLDSRMVDSIYVADSAAAAQAAFLAWYWSLSPKERRIYDREQMIPVKMARMDSIRNAKEEAQAIKDSITENTPRILQTYALPDSLHYKRIVSWTLDRDFGKIESPGIPDTTFNHHFYDYRWQREDVNATWLGVAGSPVQKYNYLQRGSREGVTFYDALEAWSFDPGNLPHYNTKTPYTELSYYGTLLATSQKESDNLHLFTTQNITPAFNFQLLFDRYGGGGFLENEDTKNKTGAVAVNYLGKKYMMHAGYISNTVIRQENGGMQDKTWVRDTTVDSREIPVMLKSANSETKKRTVFLDQQLRIPFDFINRIKARNDSTFVYNADSLDRDITTAFVGHSTEFSTYTRTYDDIISSSEGAARSFYNNNFFYDQTASADTQKVSKLDNRIYLRLQPWSSEAAVSKLDLGLGDLYLQYRDASSPESAKHGENSIYVYGGAEGRIREAVTWDAGARFYFAGTKAGDFRVKANAALSVYPFRRAKRSPLTVSAHFETSLSQPDYYVQHMYSNHYRWDNDFSRISSTTISGKVDIPYWKLQAEAGYSLLAGKIYYDSLGVARQSDHAVSVLSASLSKNFVFGPLHLDNRVLFQLSSDQRAVPVPTAAFNTRWYLQFVAQRDETKTKKILEMQLGINVWYNTQWYSPAWNPNLGVFYNQTVSEYENGPFFDIFLNMQWKKAVIFIKYQNAGVGWPLRKHDYFSADRYTVTTAGLDGLKIGIYWPFYTQPGKLKGSAAQPRETRSSGPEMKPSK